MQQEIEIETEMTLDELITELYQELTEVLTLLNLNTDYGDFTQKEIIFKAHTCACMLSAIETKTQGKCLLPHQGFKKLIAFDKLSNVDSDKIIRHLNAKLKSSSFVRLLRYHLEFVLEIELQHLYFLKENLTEEQKKCFDYSSIPDLDDYIIELPDVIATAVFHELTLLSSFYPEITDFEIALKQVEFIAQPIEDMRTQLQIEYNNFLTRNDIQDYFKGIENIDWKQFSRFKAKFDAKYNFMLNEEEKK